MNNQRKQDISTWILAHTQLAQSLEEAWQQFCKTKAEEEEGEDELRRQQYEKEKNISQIVQEVWESQIDKLRQQTKGQNNKRYGLDGECSSYNIHQEKNYQLGLKDVTKWRLSLKDFKIETQKLNNGTVELQALEFNEKEQKKTKKPKK